MLSKTLTDFFKPLDSKDWITLFASIFALAFSSITLFQKSGDTKIALRQQLTNLLEKLAALNTEISKYRNLQAKKEEYPPNYIGLMNDQRQFLVRQANNLADKISDMVTAYEYLIIAGAFDGVDQIVLAEKYFNLAIKTNQTIDKGIAIRGYARFLFSEGTEKSLQKARQLYMDSIKCFEGESDRMIAFRGNTYERWAFQEKEWSFPENEDALLIKARLEYEHFKKEQRRQQETNRIEKMISMNKQKDSLKGDEKTVKK